MEFNFELTVVSLITITSLVSPIVVTSINNSHVRKMKKLEIEQRIYENDTLHKRELAEQFLKFLGMHLSGNLLTQEDWQEYAKATWSLSPYMEGEWFFGIIANALLSGEELTKDQKNEVNLRLIPEINERFLK